MQLCIGPGCAFWYQKARSIPGFERPVGTASFVTAYTLSVFVQGLLAVCASYWHLSKMCAWRMGVATVPIDAVRIGWYVTVTSM